MTYKTALLESWPRVKELRDRHWENIAKAKERGVFLASGSPSCPAELLMGLPFDYLPSESYSATCAADPELAVELHKAVDERGYALDICHYMRTYLGSMWSDKGFLGKFPKPDLIFQDFECDSHGRWYGIVTEELGIPVFFLDHPYGEDPLGEHHLQFYIDQCYEVVEWLEKVTGMEYDKEKFIEAHNNTVRSKAIWSSIVEMNRHIPAPLDYRHFTTLLVPANQLYWLKEAVDFFKELKDEVQYRIDNGIAIVPEEKARLAHHGLPTWHHIHDLRYVNSYGAVFVISDYCFQWGNFWQERPDGTIGPQDWTWEDAKTFDEAIKRVAQRILYQGQRRQETHLRRNVKLLDDYHISGVVSKRNKGCEAALRGDFELKQACQLRGIPLVTYESNTTDPLDFDLAAVTNTLDAFLESLGLKKLPLS